MPPSTRSQRWPFIAALAALLLLAATLRLVSLNRLPLGFHYDEAANLILAAEIARGEKTPIFIPSYTGKEVAFFYWAALWVRLLGATPFALRLSAALAGLATVAVAAWASRELLAGWRQARWLGLLCAAFLASSFWHLIFSRYGFRAVTQPLLQGLTVAALWRGLRLRAARPEGYPETRRGQGWAWLVLAGLCGGLSAYTYLAVRAFPLPLEAGLAASVALAPRGTRRARALDGALVLLVAAVVLSPLVVYWLSHPGSFLTRTQQVAAADLRQAWGGIRACLAMFFLRGDPYIRFNLPLRPLFDPLTAVLFLAGIALVAYRVVRPPRAASPAERALTRAGAVFLLVALPTMLLPSALAVGDVTPSNLRAIGLLPFVYLFPVTALEALLTRAVHVTRRWHGLDAARAGLCAWPRLWQAASAVAAGALLALPTARAYFGDWARSPALYYAADGDLADVAAYLNRLPPPDSTSTAVYVASLHYRHPTLAALARDYPAIRWLVGGQTLVLPSARDALLIFPRSAAKDLPWVGTLLSDALLADAPAGPDGAPAFHVYRVTPDFEVRPSLPLSANLGNAAEVIGYDVLATPRAGKEAEIAIWWRVLGRPAAGDYSPLVRLADAWGSLWGQADAFHYPSEGWQPGELIIDHLSAPVSPGAPPGEYSLRFSLYSSQADHLLPRLDAAGRYAGTWVALPIELQRGSALTDGEVDALAIRRRLDGRATGLTLLGANLDTGRLRPGEPLRVTLFWRAEAPTRPAYTLTLLLNGQALEVGGPVHSTYPFSEWEAGEVVADRHGPRLPRDCPPGDYRLMVRLDGPGGGGQALLAELGTVRVEALTRTFTVPPMSHPLAAPAVLGGEVELLGCDLAPQPVAPGETLAVTLVWRSLAATEQDYTVFVHLVNADGAFAGQHDGQPAMGSYPTSLWLPGEIIRDRHEVAVDAAASPGIYRLEVGLYVAETGARVPLPGSADDAIRLRPVLVANP